MVISGKVIDSEEKHTKSGKRELAVRVKDDCGVVKVTQYSETEQLPEPGEYVVFNVWAQNVWVKDQNTAYVSYLGNLDREAMEVSLGV